MKELGPPGCMGSAVAVGDGAGALLELVVVAVVVDGVDGACLPHRRQSVSRCRRLRAPNKKRDLSSQTT